MTRCVVTRDVDEFGIRGYSSHGYSHTTSYEAATFGYLVGRILVVPCKGSARIRADVCVGTYDGYLHLKLFHYVMWCLISVSTLLSYLLLKLTLKLQKMPPLLHLPLFPALRSNQNPSLLLQKGCRKHSWVSEKTKELYTHFRIEIAWDLKGYKRHTLSGELYFAYYCKESPEGPLLLHAINDVMTTNLPTFDPLLAALIPEPPSAFCRPNGLLRVDGPSQSFRTENFKVSCTCFTMVSTSMARQPSLRMLSDPMSFQRTLLG
ncbi:hypothetical protein BT69DRAFT_1316545 [Atractiella rhizophila]|nr:hypothetical protein BT69DRAFT_1316545 [Atractiella rhizophila]